MSYRQSARAERPLLVRRSAARLQIAPLSCFLRFPLRSGWAWLPLLCTLLAWNASASWLSFREDPDYLIDTWDAEGSWSDLAARAMAQTPDGYLWLGTLHGPVRYDGMKLSVFDPASAPGLPKAAIMKMLVDGSGRLWCGTVSGVAVGSGADWESVRLPGTNNNRGNHLVLGLAERPGGDLLVTTYDGGVLELHAGQIHALPPPPGATNASYSGCADGAGNWWVAQQGFIGKWDGQRWMETVSLAETPNLPPGQVRCCAARDGGVWLVLGPELRHYRDGRETRRTALPGFKTDVLDLMEDSRGDVWICTKGAGLWRVSTNHLVRYWSAATGLPDDLLRFAFEDREGNLWVGARLGGLTRFRPRIFHNVLMVTNRFVFSRFNVEASPTGGVFIAQWNVGVWHADARGVTKVPLPQPVSPDSISALSLLADHSGGLWIGTAPDGVWRVQGAEARRVSIDPSGRSPISRMFEDSRGRIWLAGGQSVGVFEAGEVRIIGPREGLPPGWVNGFAEDQAGGIWLALEQGLFRRETNRWVEVVESGGGSLRVTSLLADAEGTVWMDSTQAGLVCWHEGHLFRKGLPPELPIHGVWNLLEGPRGRLWMTSPQGVLCARKQDLEAWLEGKLPRLAWHAFDVSDGLPATDCTDEARDGQGGLWFATGQGVARVDPGAELRNSRPPPVRIEELSYHRATGRTYAGDPFGAVVASMGARLQWPFPERLKLPPGSRRLEVHYTALDYTAPDSLRFQTRLEPSDTEWQDMGDRRVVDYYDFNPGSYVLRVRAVNHDGVWNEVGTSLAFTVQPFAWQTWWFRVATLAALFGLGGFTTWWLFRRRHQRELQELERNRQHQAELAHAGRVSTMGQLASSLAHELNQPLTAILSNAQAAQRFLANDQADPNEVRDILADIVAEDKRAGEVIRRLRLLLKKGEVQHQPLSVNDVILEVLKFMRSELVNQDFTVQTHLAPDLPIIHADGVQLQQVLLNLVMNACEAMAGAESGARELTLRTSRHQDGSVHISVADCGPGIPPEKLEQIFESFYTTKPQGMGLGLAVCRTIITAHGGNMWATNNPGRGATVHFTLPVGGSNQ